MDIDRITAPEPLPDDEHNFADAAFKRVSALCHRGDIEDEDELEQFLEAEVKEYDRQAAYLSRMTKYFHENAARAMGFEAAAYRLMLTRLDGSQ